MQEMENWGSVRCVVKPEEHISYAATFDFTAVTFKSNSSQYHKPSWGGGGGGGAGGGGRPGGGGGGGGTAGAGGG
jgi:hypothetical protein